ncbi:MAG TPA: hypothetical protein VD963_03260, partial [Phycisphaerales bacterium]|nr:hypothetical protein [Phycisphaerales bacterium]
MPGATTTGPAKTCMFCGLDCAGKPRIKDARGRYACKDCAARHAARTGSVPATPRPAPPGRADDELEGIDLGGAVAAEAVAHAPTPMQGCPDCGGHLDPAAVLCVRCGYDTRTRRGARTKIAAERDERAPRTRRRRGIHISGSTFAFIMIGLLAALFALAQVEPSMAIAYLVVAGLYTFGYYILLVITPFQDGDTAWGVVNIFSFVPIIGLATLYYVFCVSERASLQVMFLAQFLAG